MNTESLDEFISTGALKQFEVLNSSIEVATGEMKKLTTEAATLVATLGGNQNFASFVANMQKVAQVNQLAAKTAVEVAKVATESAKQQTEASKQQATATMATAKASTESSKQTAIQTKVTIALTKEQERLNKLANQAATTTARQTTEYGKLNAEYKLAADNAKNLGALQIRLQKETESYAKSGIFSGFSEADNQHKLDKLKQLTPVLKDAQEQALKLSNSLYSVEIATGQGQRKVGQYNEAARGLRDILRDTPAFAYSVGTGISAISNNIPTLLDGIKKINEANKTLVANGEKPISVLKTLGKELLSFEGIAAIAVAAITIFAARMSMVHAPIDKAAESLKKYKETIASIDENTYINATAEIARMNILVNVAKDLGEATDVRLGAVQALQKEFPQYFANLKDEAILNGDVSKQVDKTTEALLRQAQAEAALSKFKEVSRIEYQLQKDKEKAIADLEKAKEDTRKLPKGQEMLTYMESGQREKIIRGIYPIQDLLNLQKNITDISAKHAKIVEEQKGYLKDAQNFGKELVNVDKTIPNTIEAYQKQIEHLQRLRDNLTDVTTVQGAAKAKELTAEIKRIQKIIDDLQGKKEGATGGGSADSSLFAAEKRLSDKRHELRVKELENTMAINEAIYRSDEYTFEQRQQAADEYAQAAYQIAISQKQNELEVVTAKEKEIEGKIAAANKGTLKLTKDGRKALNIDLETAKLEHENIEKELTNSLSDIVIKRNKTIEDIYRTDTAKWLKIRQDDLSQALVMYQSSHEQEQEQLRASFDAKLIGQKKYHEESKRLAQKYNAITLQVQLDEYAKELENLNLSEEQQKAIYDKIAAAKKGQTGNQDPIQGGNPLLDKIGVSEEQFSIFSQQASATIALIDGITAAQNAQYESEIANIERAKAALDEKSKIEIDAINHSAHSEKEKQDMIDGINAQTAQKKKQFDEEEKKLKHQRDIADRAAALAQIVEQTAISAISAFKIDPTGILSGLITAAGLEAFLKVSTVPLPAYAEGTDYHKGGLALYGEAGRELIIEPNKAPYIVDEATIGNLARGTMVIPEKKLFPQMGMLTPELLQSVSLQGDSAKVVSELMRTGERIENAVKSMPVTTYRQSPFGSWSATTKNGGNTTNWLNKVR